MSTTTQDVQPLTAGDPADLVARTTQFVRECVLPVEDRFDGDVGAAGYSVFGAMAINAAAPDEGNILPLVRIAREVRPFRIYDGPSEVHRFAIAKRAVKAARLRASS